MKNKSSLTYYSFLVLCCLSFLTNAQNKKANNDFEISVFKYSDKPNYINEHDHILELKNNSKFKSEYKLLLEDDNCAKNGINKKESNIESNIYFENINKSEIDNIISLEPNESIKIHLNTKIKDNATLDSWNCSLISVIKLSKNKSKSTKSKVSKSIRIKTFIPNPNHKGH